MSKSIELLVKLHNPKCVSAETAGRGGKSQLYKEQIVFAFAQAEKEFMVGYHLLMCKYRQDPLSREFVNNYVESWLEENGFLEHAMEALSYVVDMVCDLPLPSQIKHMNCLRKRYLRSQYVHLAVIDKANKAAEENRLSPNSAEARQLRIRELNEVRKSNTCPRCRGTGEVGRVQKRECPECKGKGKLRANIYHLMKSTGCTEVYFKRYLNALVVDFERHCYEEMSGAEDVIKKQLRSELQ
ncbi:hypothetical protein HYE54_12020 [Aggregatibacter actinomycetemcomitans]|uniref:TIGR02642 family protein n=1 Tax=Aggregatibacter actinomycetemcomitans TaxID=714 RepID=UPI00197B4890|nr:TIGR02642 family protein [Aggregatibacter actinomycetemcomitans]MBN6069426.1 hypothetical protein [Aggregatibacter actinomycetemcomitans]MBN6087088.1 hypothetical protein [Aggregatibacter actinomycetemcomitans]